MLCLLGLLVVVGVVNANVGVTCVSQAQCGKGECCMQPGHFKGKRDGTGTCQTMGSHDQSCYMEDRFHYNGMYTNKCPCASNSKCVSTGIMEVPYGMIGKCVTSTKRETSCHTGADCGADECCVSLMRPLGKRQMGGGTCKPMGTNGSGCLMRSGNHGKPHDMVFSCPCQTGFKCEANGQFDIPLGAMGEYSFIIFHCYNLTPYLIAVAWFACFCDPEGAW